MPLSVSILSKPRSKERGVEGLFNIGDIVKKYAIPYSTVNHYSDIGLLNVVKKMKNIRLYDEADTQKRLKIISDLKDKGYPLRLIQRELAK